MGGGGKSGDDKEPGGFLNPKNSDLVFGKGGLLNPKKVKVPPLPTPPKFDSKDAAKMAQAAALKKKKSADAAYGYEDTILTSPAGLGGVPNIYQGNKTLTGT
jgi:hypothetical protein